MPLSAIYLSVQSDVNRSPPLMYIHCTQCYGQKYWGRKPPDTVSKKRHPIRDTKGGYRCVAIVDMVPTYGNPELNDEDKHLPWATY